MKRLLILYILSVIYVAAFPQKCELSSYKVQAISGNIIPLDKYFKNIIQSPAWGVEGAVEWNTRGEKAWHQYTGFPIIGVGGVYMNLGNPSKLGDALAVYPYACFRLLDMKFIRLNVKVGVGMSYLTKTYYNTNMINDSLLPLKSSNYAIGSNLNVFLVGGGNLEIPIYKNFSLTADYVWNHMSNGSFVAPNTGINMLNAYCGIKYTPTGNDKQNPIKTDYPEANKELQFEVIASGGSRQLYYLDNASFLIGSMTIAMFKPLTNYLRMGIGLDGFYDGAYNGNTKFERTYLTTDELKNKLRGGLSWQNEIMMGRLSAGFHLGLYLYDPLKNLEPYEDVIANKGKPLSKPIIYAYNIDKEDGWLYTRASVKYLITNHLLLSVGLKTHLQKAEFIEWGLGYRF